MEIDIALGRPQGFASLSSEARIKLNAAKAERFEVKKKAALAKVKAATTAAKPAFKALEKAKKAGRVPSAVKDAAKKAQAVIDAWQEKADHAAKRISEIEARNAFHRKNLDAKSAKPAKAVKPAKTVKEPVVKKATKKDKVEPVVKKSSRRPEKRVVSRPGAIEKTDKVVKVEKPKKALKGPALEQKPTTNMFPKSHPEDAKFALPYVNPALFEKARTSASARRQYMDQLWTKLNATAFHGRMQKPILALMPKVSIDRRTRTLGLFTVNRNGKQIKLSHRLFLGEEPMLIASMAHEMAHQYVWEVVLSANPARGRLLNVDGGHGPEWRAAMTNIGLTPARFSSYDSASFMTDDERATVQKSRENLARAKKMHESMPPYMLTRGTRAVIVESKNPDMRFPVFVLGNKGKKFDVYGLGPHRTGRYAYWANAPLFYMPTPEETRKLDDQWREEAMGVGRAIAENRENRKAVLRERRARRGADPFDLMKMLKGFTGL